MSFGEWGDVPDSVRMIVMTGALATAMLSIWRGVVALIRMARAIVEWGNDMRSVAQTIRHELLPDGGHTLRDDIKAMRVEQVAVAQNLQIHVEQSEQWREQHERLHHELELK